MKKQMLALLFCLSLLALPVRATEDTPPIEPAQDTVTQTPDAAENTDVPSEEAEASQTPDAPEQAEGEEEPAPSSPFKRTLLYEGAFSDLAQEDGYFENIAALYEYGLSKGRGDGTYGGGENVTVGELLTFAARIRSTYDLGDGEAGAAAEAVEGAPWYAGYAAYLRSVGVIADEFEGLYDTVATRAQTAHVLANALDASWFDARNAAVVNEGYATRQYITDVDDYTPYQPDILALYRRGIVQGLDEAGSFRPGQTITRGEIAAMLTRIVDPALRVEISWIIIPR